jgi:flagellar biosynthetic protein FliQ
MNDAVMTFARDAMFQVLLIGGPALVVSLAVGLAMGIFQAATQINETALSFIPKLVAILLVLAFTGPWMLDSMAEFMRHSLTSFKDLIDAG